MTDPRAADYEIVDYPTAIEQLSATMLRSVIGSMDLEQTLTSRDKINAMLRGVLDEASGKWGIRVTRVEIKAIDPAPSITDAMEKQYRAQQEKRGAILVAEGEKQAAILKSEGQASAIEKVFKAIHEGHPDPELVPICVFGGTSSFDGTAAYPTCTIICGRSEYRCQFSQARPG